MFEAKHSRPDAKPAAANDRAAPRPAAAPGASPAWTALAWTVRDLPVQRWCACEGSDEPCNHCAEEEPFRRPAPGAPPGVGHTSVAPALASGGGRPLDPATNAYFSARFGRDFGDVRVQTDDASARAAGALAYTVGSQIVFRGGAFATATRDGRNLLAHELAHVVQQHGGARRPQRAGGPRDRHEAEAERAAEEAVAGRSVGALTAVAPPRPHRQPAPTTFVAEDTAPDLEPGQMRKTEFLRLLREATCRAVEEALAGTGHTTDSCPYLDRWFAYYSGREAEHIDRALRRYAPDTATAATAAEAIRAVAARARRAAEHWVATGEVTGVPPDFDVAATGLGAVGGAASAVAGADSGAATAVGGAISGAARAVSGLLFSARPGGARPAPASVVGRALGAGRPLETGVRSRMEGAFGRSFGGVRVHADGGAASLSDRLNARAFTLGSDIVFGAGELRPGTLAGDAVIAHELAHVAQQSRGPGAGAADAALEGEADTAAADAILGRRAAARLGGGLRLQRCSRRRALPAPSPTDYLVTGRKIDPGDATNIYFDRASVTIDPAEQPKIPSVIAMAGAAAPLTLVGYRSEDEVASLATSRPTAVSSVLGTSVPTPHTGVRTVQPEPARGIGEINYRDMRKVEIQMPPMPGFVTPRVPACPTPVIPCGTSFTTARPRAITFLDTAIAALAGPLAPTTTTLLTQLFGGASGPASAPTIQANLTALKAHITAMAAPGRHVCHETRCDGGCKSDAYNTEVGAAAVMTLCSGFINDPSVDNRAWTLIHEGAHGTAGLAAVDISYGTERRVRTLTNAEALRNTDSYVLLVRLINFPGSVPIGFAGDVSTGMAAAEEVAAATALAHAEKWLIQSSQDLGSAYARANASIAAGVWTGTTAAYDRETLHRLAGRFAGLTDPGTSAPFALPTAADKEKLAALSDRYDRMFRVMYVRGITMRKIPVGSDRWAAGPGSTVELTPAFFALPNAVAQIRRLIELLAAATPGISAPLVPQYVDAADAIRAHRGLGP